MCSLYMHMVPNVLTHNKQPSKVKTMLSVFFDITGILNHEYLPSWQLVNQNINKESV